MKTRIVAISTAVALLVLPAVLLANEDVTLTALDPWQTEFSGRDVIRRYRVESKRAWEGRLTWTLSSQERTLARGEQRIEVATNSAADAAVKFRLDRLRDGVVIPAQLDVALIHKETELARIRRTLSFFSDDPFANRGQRLAELKIVLFDPAARTANVLISHRIPYTATRNLDFVRQLKAGVLILGAGTSLDAQRGLLDAVLAAASHGTRVLCLEWKDGALPLVPLANAKELCFKDESIIRALDARLDTLPWRPGDTRTAAGLRLAVENQQAVARAGDGGWPWFEARWPETNGRFIYCAFPIVEHWNANPTPRYLLLRLLDRLTAEEG